MDDKQKEMAGLVLELCGKGHIFIGDDESLHVVERAAVDNSYYINHSQPNGKLDTWVFEDNKLSYIDGSRPPFRREEAVHVAKLLRRACDSVSVGKEKNGR